MFAYPQQTTLGFYQLSRLYYCFARDKVNSSEGYPNWVFIIMFAYAIVCYVAILFFSIDHYVISCGINGRYQTYTTDKQFGDRKWYYISPRMFTKSAQSKDDKVRENLINFI